MRKILLFLGVLILVLGLTVGIGNATLHTIIDEDSITYKNDAGDTVMIIDEAGVSVPLYIVQNTYSSMTVTSTTDASSLTTGSITTVGGVSIKKQLYLGDDLDMSVSGSATYDITLRTNVADALSITDGTDIITFRTASTRMVTITPALTVTGPIISDSTDDTTSTVSGAIQTDGGIGMAKALWVGTTSQLVGDVQIDGSLTISESGVGTDVKIWGNNALYFTWFDASADTDGAWFIGGEDQKGLDMTWYGTAASSYMKWDKSVDDLLLAGSGIVFSGGQAGGIIFGGTIDEEVIKIGGTYDHGIYFSEDMANSDVTNSFINIGDYSNPIAVVPSGANMFGIVHNVTMTANVGYWYQAYYTKIATSGTTDDTSIAGHAYRLEVDSDLVAVYGVQSHVILSGARTFTSEVTAGSFYLDVGSTTISSVGSRTNALQAVVIGSATVTSDFTVADFSAATNASLDAILHLHIVASATTTSTLHIENDGTTTNMLHIDNDGTATVGILFEGSIATGISLAGTYSTAAIDVGVNKIEFYDSAVTISGPTDGDMLINADATLIVTCPSITFAGTIGTAATFGILVDYDAPFATIGNLHSAMLDLDVTTTSSVAGAWDVNGRLYGARITVNLVHQVTNTYALKAKVLTTGTTSINDVVGVFGELEIDGTHTYGQTDSSMAALRGDISNLSDGSWTGQVYTLFLNYGSKKNYGLETAWIHAYNHADSYLDYGIHLIQNSTAQAIAVGIWLDIEATTTMTKGIFLDNAGTLTIGIDIGDAVTAINLDGTYTTGLKIAGTLASPDARAIKSSVIIDVCDLEDGYGTNEFQLEITGTSAGPVAAMSSWVNMVVGTHGAGGDTIAAITTGIYQNTAEIVGATIIFGMKMQGQVVDTDMARYCPFAINIQNAGTNTIDAIWDSASPLYLAYAVDTTDDAPIGTIPFFIDSNNKIYYIRLYD